MTINLYSTADDPRKVSKTLTTIASDVVCKPAEPCSMLEPRILLNYSASYNGANYIYISDFDSYYYAEKTLVTGGELLLTCKLDPLMSFGLSNIDVTVVRSEIAGVNYVKDSQLPIDPNRFTTYGEPFSGDIIDLNDSDTHHYILVLNQGGV